MKEAVLQVKFSHDRGGKLSSVTLIQNGSYVVLSAAQARSLSKSIAVKLRGAH